jgi:hypothetical protein
MMSPGDIAGKPKISAVLEKFEDGETEPFEKVYIENEIVVKIEKRGVDY